MRALALPALPSQHHHPSNNRYLCVLSRSMSTENSGTTIVANDSIEAHHLTTNAIRVNMVRVQCSAPISTTVWNGLFDVTKTCRSIWTRLSLRFSTVQRRLFQMKSAIKWIRSEEKLTW